VTLARTLSSYIGRHFLIWCSVVFLGMLTITFMLDYLELIRRGGSKVEATLLVLLEMAALKLPHMAQEVMPFAILFGTMMAFWRLTRSNELIVAARSASRSGNSHAGDPLVARHRFGVRDRLQPGSPRRCRRATRASRAAS